MATGVKVGTTDLDDIFDPYVEGTKPAATNIKVGTQDLRDRFAPLSFGTSAAATGIKVGTADLNTLFAKKGTAQYITWNLPEIFAASNSNQSYTSAYVGFELRNNGEIWTYVNNPREIKKKLANYVSDPSKLSQYEVLVTKISGNATVMNAGSWQNLGTSRAFGYDVEMLDTIYNAACTVQIRKVGTTTIVASTTASLSAFWSSG